MKVSFYKSTSFLHSYFLGYKCFLTDFPSEGALQVVSQGAAQVIPSEGPFAEPCNAPSFGTAFGTFRQNLVIHLPPCQLYPKYKRLLKAK